jgi:hypothetical protein
MKMGTTASPWHYDVGAFHSLQSASLRRPAILRYVSWAAVCPMSQGWSSPRDWGRFATHPAGSGTHQMEMLSYNIKN